MGFADRAAPPAFSVRSLERALDLLTVLEGAPHPLGLSDLGRATSLPKATARRLLSVLERRGLVQWEQGRFRLGVGVVPLARTFLTGDSLSTTALPVLEELALISGETVSLHVRQRFDRVVVQWVDSPHPLRFTIRIGQRLPLHVGASGQILAASMPEEELGQLLEQLSEVRLASGEVLTKEQLLAKLERVRQQGFATSVQEREIGVFSVAAPVLKPDGRTIAAIAVTGPLGRMTLEKMDYLSVEVRRAAREIVAAYHHI